MDSAPDAFEAALTRRGRYAYAGQALEPGKHCPPKIEAKPASTIHALRRPAVRLLIKLFYGCELSNSRARVDVSSMRALSQTVVAVVANVS
jgi:hypothetical protein